MRVATGCAWLAKGANLPPFGPSGCGESHLTSALGGAPVENGHRVLFARTADLVQRLQAARARLATTDGARFTARVSSYGRTVPRLDDPRVTGALVLMPAGERDRDVCLPGPG